MKKETRLVCGWLMGAMIAGLCGCAHKPAYSEMDANRPSNTENKNKTGGGQATASTPTSVEPPPANPVSPPPTPPPATAFKPPSFMDQAKGDIRDLPAYPRAYRVNLQVGPMQGANMMSLALKTNDPMDKITTFYEKVIKDNKWTVTDKVIDPEFSEWNLKKGDSNSAKVQVKKDQQSRTMDIVVVRAEKLEEPAK